MSWMCMKPIKISGRHISMDEPISQMKMTAGNMYDVLISEDSVDPDQGL